MTTDQQILDHCRRMNGRLGDGIPQWQLDLAAEFKATAKKEARSEMMGAMLRHARAAAAADNLPGPSQ